MEIKKATLTIGIAILFVLFIVFFVDAVYEQPQYEDFCDYAYASPLRVDFKDSNCVNNFNQTLFNECSSEKGELKYEYDSEGCQVNAACDFCNSNFRDVNAKYNKNIFFISAIIALIVLIKRYKNINPDIR